MNKEEIRKLLGGYATNTLTESERNALYEAALDDQDLFNALQQEQALKNLLADPAARAEIRQALDRPASGKPSAGRLRWWAWGGAIGAVAAAAALLVVFRPNPATLGKRPVEIASAEKPAPRIAPPEQPTVAREPKRAAPAQANQAINPSPRARIAHAPSPETRGELAPNAPAPTVAPALAAAPPAAPPPVIPPPVQADRVDAVREQLQATGSVAAGQGGQAPSQGVVGGAAVSQLSQRSPLAANRFSALSTGAKANPASTLHYSWLKRDPSTNNFVPEADLKPGDLVRMQVSTAVPGRVILSRRNDAGEWQNVAEVTATANSTYAIPEMPITVPGEAQRFRLTLDASLTLAKDSETRAKSAARAEPAAPVVLEITLGGKRPN
jgi:hypothetical protein